MWCERQNVSLSGMWHTKYFSDWDVINKLFQWLVCDIQNIGVFHWMRYDKKTVQTFRCYKQIIKTFEWDVANKTFKWLGCDKQKFQWLGCEEQNIIMNRMSQTNIPVSGMWQTNIPVTGIWRTKYSSD